MTNTNETFKSLYFGSVCNTRSLTTFSQCLVMVYLKVYNKVRVFVFVFLPRYQRLALNHTPVELKP